MLTPDQIIPFVTHEDPLVREHVVQYFDKPSTYGPLTAEHYWQAIDRFGMEESRRFLTHLEDVPQTNASVARLLAMLRDKPSERVRHDLQQTAGKIEFNLLRDHRDELFDCEHIGPEAREHLRERLRLSDESGAALWDRLMSFGKEIGG